GAIDAELAADDTAGGARRAATARASRPTVEAKEEAEALLRSTGEDAPSNALVRATLLGIDPPGHEHLLTGVAERYLETVTALRVSAARQTADLSRALAARAVDTAAGD